VIEVIEPVIVPVIEVIEPVIVPVIEVIVPVIEVIVPVIEVVPPMVPIDVIPEVPAITPLPGTPAVQPVLSPASQSAAALGTLSNAASTTRDGSALATATASIASFTTIQTAVAAGLATFDAPVAEGGVVAATSLYSQTSPTDAESTLLPPAAPLGSTALQLSAGALASGASAGTSAFSAAANLAPIIALLAIGGLFLLAVTEASSRSWQFRLLTPPA
jgi:hypothetical protein